MSAAETIAAQFSGQTQMRSETAVFVRMEGPLAVVNIGVSTIKIPCVGFFPPVTGMPVRVDWVDGSPSVTGPTRPLSPLGQITGTGTPKATVTVDGVSYSLYFRAGYTPAVGDTVEVNWSTGIIQGKVTGFQTAEKPAEQAPPGGAYDITIRAKDSGRYQSDWWGNDPWASDNNSGIWVYGTAISDAVGAGTVDSAQIFLPLVQEAGNASIGSHAHSSIPSGAPSLANLTALPVGGRGGWVDLPLIIGQYLAGGGRGVGVTAPGAGGYNIWRGTNSDPLSGAVRLTGSR
ncbi:hypothetical protein [Microbacterium sp. MMO-10]|uniref:hypothetical protein n=1 Tax=Microbacterium sp. MMO-10 TaxID=3081272 RepID=UPI003016D6CC